MVEGFRFCDTIDEADAQRKVLVTPWPSTRSQIEIRVQFWRSKPRLGWAYRETGDADDAILFAEPAQNLGGFFAKVNDSSRQLCAAILSGTH